MNKTSNQKAITLVALIITVIVLLILAVVAINAVSGDGILGYAKSAREIYEIEQIKEEAELVKLGMQMDIASGGLNKDRLLTKLNEHFTGSTLAENIVTTADGKYDIIVDDDLNITVEKHGENGGQDETTGIRYTIEDYDEEQKIIRLSYIATAEDIEWIFGYAGEPITDEIREQLQEQAESLDITYEEMLLEFMLQLSGSTITDEQRTQYKEQGPLIGLNTYQEVLQYILEQSDFYFVQEYTASFEGEPVEVEDSSIIATNNGTYKVVATIISGKTVEAEIPVTGIGETPEEPEIPRAEEKFSAIYTASADYTDVSGKKARIPAGFAVGTSENIDDISEGLVITDKVDSEGYSIGNEFVWIPVENINNMVMCQIHGASTTINQETLECETCGENTKLAGKLYATELGEHFNASLTGQTYSVDSGFREPANLSGNVEFSGDSSSHMSSWTQTLYQDSFNAMVESVAKYKGFYVGRYETSLNGSTAQSKLGESPMNNITWFRMYENSKTYSSTNTSLGVVSEMIWGSQWDAMLKFILTTEDASHVTAANNVSHNLSDLYKTGGTNYYNYDVDVKYNDKSANIYDLEGNEYEWTQEANDTYLRVLRGGFYDNSNSPSTCNSSYPTLYSSDFGSRLSLYVEV